MTRKNTLNNYILDNARKSREYQAVITDLAIEGAIPLEAAERILGYEIPEYLKSPSGKSVERKAARPAKKKAAAKEEAPPTPLGGGNSLFKEE